MSPLVSRYMRNITCTNDTDYIILYMYMFMYVGINLTNYILINYKTN